MNESVGVIHTKTIQCNQLYITETQGWKNIILNKKVILYLNYIFV